MTTRLLPQRLARRLGTACMAVSLSLGGAAAFAQSEHQFVLDAREALRKKDKAQLAAATRHRAAASAGAMGRVLGVGQPTEHGPGRRDRGLLRPLARHLCRGPAAQRLAARTGQAARLGQLQPRLPALSHERRPRGQLLFPAHPSPDGHGRARRRAQCLVRAARARRWLQPAGQHAVCGRAVVRGRRLAEGPAGHRIQPPAFGARRGGTGRPGGGGRGGRAQREPGPLPEPQGGARRWRRGRAGHAGLAAAGRQRPRRRRRQLKERWQSGLPSHLAALAWAGTGKQAAQKLLPDAAAHYQRAWALQREPSAGQARSGALVRRHAGLAGALGAAQPRAGR